MGTVFKGSTFFFWIVTAVMLSGIHCQSINQANLAGRRIISVEKSSPVILNSGGAPLRDCIDLLDQQGATTLNNATGPVVDPFEFSRLLGWEYCMAVGTE